MAYSKITYTADGSADSFTIPFEYINKVDVQVFLNSTRLVFGTDYTFMSDTVLKFTTKPTGTVLIQRVTPRDKRLVDFQDATVLTEADLDTSAKQSLFIAQESLDTADGALRVPASEGAGLVIPTQAVRVNTLLGFDASGNPMAYSAGLLPSLPVTPFMSVALTKTTGPSMLAYLGGAPTSALSGDSSISFSVAPATLAYHAVRKDQMDAALAALPGRNRVINGAMEVSQRGTSFAISGTAPFTLDRWRISLSTPATATVSQDTDVPAGAGLKNSLLVTIGTAAPSCDVGNVGQVVEGINCFDLVGRPFTMSFWVKASKAGKYTLGIEDSSGTMGYPAEYTINSANAWEYKTIQMPSGLSTDFAWDKGTTAGARFRFHFVSGAAYSTSPNAWNQSGISSSVNQTNIPSTAGATFRVTGVQIEAGSVATPYERRMYGYELSLCQRYFCKFISHPIGYSLASNICSSCVVFPVTMRTTPSLVPGATYSVGAGNAGTVGTSTFTANAAKFYNTANNWTTSTDVNISASFECEL